MVVDNLKLKSFILRIAEKLGKLDSDTEFDVPKAPPALPRCRSDDRDGRENAFVHGFQTQVGRERRSHFDGNEPRAEVFGHDNI